MLIRSTLLALAAFAALATPAEAQGWGRGHGMDRGDTIMPRGERHEQQAQARTLSVRELIGIVQQQRGGSLAGVEGGMRDAGGRPFYVFRWRYPSGMVEMLRVDATNGQVF
jgi:uncharacterized membrane protein YkoI